MTYRTLHREIMHYGSFDRVPVIHWGEWKETRERWIREGLPPDQEPQDYFKATPLWTTFIQGSSWLGLGSALDDINIGLFPPFEEEVFEETDEQRVFRAPDGVVCQEWKYKTSIPKYTDYTLRDARQWPEYKMRLQPHPARIAPDIEQRIKAKEQSDLPVCMPVGSLMGWIRNWMGVENMAYLMYDNRDTYVDMVMTITDLICWAIDQILPRVQIDFAHGWEDICGRAGPLISPEIFEQCVAPGYKKIRNKLESYGVTLYSVDSDGDISSLVGHWLDAGVNLMFPLEVGPFKGDARAYRAQYGKELHLMGNFDKMALERGQAAVEAEIERLMPLIKEGGYILVPDHHITPGVSLEDYRWYTNLIRSIRI